MRSLAAPPIGKEVPDLEPALPRPAFFSYLRSHDLLLGLPLGTHLEFVVSRQRRTPTPPALGGGRFFVHWRYCPVRHGPVFSW